MFYHSRLATRGFGLLFLMLLAASWLPTAAKAQMSSAELFSSYQNRVGISDTATEKMLAQRQAIRAGYDVQAMEGPIDPTVYVLGPGDGVYLNVYAMHALDQDLTVTPEGRLLLPRIGQVSVAGLTVSEAEKKVNDLLAHDYKSPNASLSMRKLRPIKVNVLGEVLAPGVQSGTSLQRVSEFIDRSGGLRQSSSLRNIEIRTITGQVRAHADIFRYYAVGDLSANPTVQAGDVIVVPQATHFVTISGSVGSPGRMEFSPGDSLSSVIHLAKGLLPSALIDTIEIARFSESDPGHAQRFNVLYGSGHDIPLQDGDAIFIRSLTQYHVPRMASVGGEVMYPGRYAIEPGITRVKDLLSRAGGVLPSASLEEAALIRRVGTGSYESDAELARLQSVSALRKEGMTEQEYSYYTGRLQQLNRSIMVIDFKSLIQKNDESQNLLLREEDSINFPRARGFVTVSGRVNSQGNVSYFEGGNYEDYISKAGGYSAGADKGGVRVVNARTGSYIDPSSDRVYRIGPGDMIVVPQERPEFWKNLNSATAITSQILTIVLGVYLLVKK